MFWSSRSPFARKAVMAAHECGLIDRIELVSVPIPSPTPHAELNRASPIAKLPALVTDEGAVIVDSPVICEYFDDLGEGGLFPRTSAERWRAMSRQAMADGMLDMLLLWRAELRRPEAGRLPKLLTTYQNRLVATLDRFEAEAAARHGFDIGDLTTGVLLSYLDFRFAEQDWRSGRPLLCEAHERFSARTSAMATAFAD